jgi:hypothetical protein
VQALVFCKEEAVRGMAKTMDMALQSAFAVPQTSGYRAPAQHPTVQISPSDSNVLSKGIDTTEMVVAAVTTVGAVGALLGRGKRARQAMTKVRTQVSQLRAFENELGVQAPVGFWDPLGFTEEGDVDDFRRRREVELKNGRVAMFATMGYITPEYYKLPGLLSPTSGLKFADVPNGLKAINAVPVEGWMQIVALGGFYELCVNVPVDPAQPGNYGRGKLGFTGESIADPEQRKRGLNAEFANGRLAMMAIVGMWFQDGLTGSAWGDWDLYTGSPLRAFEN